ncbi:1-aminocyclopropane-1-carboxylate deaminase/D-cysteine desulfhydrase [Nubsella zeaxanthinifaciens]|uniref:1-aminocyclopropane-1-carboxylate deaminase/D-cysteine desulfhydrase n=1 Tax=Nubsella zeaxanthinifaciens TaxID=392412 RepID=UPI003D05232D
MQLPSPIHQVSYRGFNFFLKRDDLIDPFVSGNKWRKLKYIIQKAQQQNSTQLVTFGGAYSNHLLATAAAAAKHRLKASAFVRGEMVNNELLMLCKLFGMQLHFVDRNAYMDKQLLFDQHYSNANAYFINEGGASEEAVLGCSEIISELQEPFDHIFCAAGTGTTAAGLLRGINQSQLHTRLHVVPVLKPGEFIQDEIAAYEKNTNCLNLHCDYHFGGYAKTNPQLIQFIKDFTAQTGILLDPIYTGKMCYAIIDLIEKGILSGSDKILAIHTGGLFGIFGKKDEFDKF